MSQEHIQTTDTGAVDITDATDAQHYAFGIVLPEGGCEAALRTILRATLHGFDVLAISQSDDPDTHRLIQHAGATFVEAVNEDMADPEGVLTGTAQAHGYSGLIVHRPGERVDFEASHAAADEIAEYAVPAVTEPAAQTTDVLAAIPAYNEEGTIGDVVRAAQRHVDTVLVVNDGSADATAERAVDAGAVVIEHRRNRGYGAALKTAFAEAERRSVETLVILDGDGQHDPADIPTLIERLRADDAAIAIGSRFGDGSKTEMPAYRRIGIGIVNALTNLSIGVPPGDGISDTQSGFRAYDREVIETIVADDAIGDRMEASIDILYHAHEYDYDIVEVGTTVDYDVEDGNTWNPVSHGLSLVNNILMTVERKHPILFLGVPGFTGSIAGLGFGYWTVMNYVATGTFPLGIAFASSFFLLAGIFACFTAIVLHSIQQHLYI